MKGIPGRNVTDCCKKTGDIGQPLFHRSTNRLILTSTGAEYAIAVRQVLDQAEKATLQLMAYGDKDAHLTLALLPTFGSRWLVPRLGEFVALHPWLQLTVTTMSCQLLL